MSKMLPQAYSEPCFRAGCMLGRESRRWPASSSGSPSVKLGVPGALGCPSRRQRHRLRSADACPHAKRGGSPRAGRHLKRSSPLAPWLVTLR